MSKSNIIYPFFSRWLRRKIASHDISVHSMADLLHVSSRTIYRHINKERNPSFSYVVTYCWFFKVYYGDEDDPLDIWDLVEGGET